MAFEALSPSPGTLGEGGGGFSSFVIDSNFGFRNSDFAKPHSGHLSGVARRSYPQTLHLPLARPRPFHHFLENQNAIPAKTNTKNQCGTFTYLPPYSGQITSVPNPSIL